MHAHTTSACSKRTTGETRVVSVVIDETTVILLSRDVDDTFMRQQRDYRRHHQRTNKFYDIGRFLRRRYL